MDSRLAAADLAGGNRELLQTLAIEASTVLENARLLEEERAKQQMEEELNSRGPSSRACCRGNFPPKAGCAARQQRGLARGGRRLLRRHRRSTRVAGASVVADVSGKGVSSALLASLLQGALITAHRRPGRAGAPASG